MLSPSPPSSRMLKKLNSENEVIMMKELYISPEATLVGFVASQNMADIEIDWAAMDPAVVEGAGMGSGSDIEVPV